MHILVTKRLTIRPPLEVDCDDLALHLADEKLRARLPRAPNGHGREDVAGWVRERCVAARSGQGLAFTIHRERLIGAITLDGLNATARLGWFLAPAWAGRGYMAEALDAVLAHAFDKTGVRVVRSAASADDPAALRLQATLGFVVEGSHRIWSESRATMVAEYSTRLDRAAFRRGGFAAAA